MYILNLYMVDCMSFSPVTVTRKAKYYDLQEKKHVNLEFACIFKKYIYTFNKANQIEFTGIM